MTTYTLKTATKFEDFDTATKQTVYKTFPAGTQVKDCLRVANPNPSRLVAPVGVVGFIASVPLTNLK